MQAIGIKSRTEISKTNKFKKLNFVQPIIILKMKNAMTILLVLMASMAMAQGKTETVKIKTSAQCGMCKETIETQMAMEKGVKTSELDVKSKILTVTFDPKKTSIEKIKERVTKTGYDADDMPAIKEAHDKLPACCQKGGHDDKSMKKHDDKHDGH
jgi:periplasmic mercuric ion binding protein